MKHYIEKFFKDKNRKKEPVEEDGIEIVGVYAKDRIDPVHTTPYGPAYTLNYPPFNLARTEVGDQKRGRDDKTSKETD